MICTFLFWAVWGSFFFFLFWKNLTGNDSCHQVKGGIFTQFFMMWPGHPVEKRSCWKRREKKMLPASVFLNFSCPTQRAIEDTISFFFSTIQFSTRADVCGSPVSCWWKPTKVVILDAFASHSWVPPVGTGILNPHTQKAFLLCSLLISRLTGHLVSRWRLWAACQRQEWYRLSDLPAEWQWRCQPGGGLSLQIPPQLEQLQLLP